MIIAVDGSAASGKGTLAKRLARHFDLAHLDTGGLYRALALQLMQNGVTAETAEQHSAAAQIPALDLRLIASPAIRDDGVAGMASVIAAMPAVRAEFLTLQRDFANHPPTGQGAVLDGRDIGSVVLPDASVKFFVDADLEVRARRRTNELQAAEQSVMFHDVLADIQARDARDRGRSIAPLRAVEDAKLIDTSGMDADQVFSVALAHIESAGIWSGAMVIWTTAAPFKDLGLLAATNQSPPKTREDFQAAYSRRADRPEIVFRLAGPHRQLRSECTAFGLPSFAL